MKETKYRVADYGSWGGYVAERYERCLFWWRWRPVKIPKPNGYHDEWIYLGGSTPEEVNRKIVEYVRHRNENKEWREAQRVAARERDKTKGQIVVDEFTLMER